MNVIEIDGPPMAYFEVSDGTHSDGEPRVMRLIYRTVACIADTELAAKDWLDKQIESVRALCHESDAFIIWRTRPEVYQEGGVHVASPTEAEPERTEWFPPRWKARARFITSHPMPAALWDAMVTHEGAETRRV